MNFRKNRIKLILSDPCSREYFRLVYLLASALCHKDVIMNSVRAKVFFVFLLLTMFSPLASADTPVWTFTPDPSFPNTVTLDINSTALVKYTVTSQSGKPHTLAMKPKKGIVPTVSGCSSSCPSSSDTLCLPTRGSTCLLTLTLNGRQLQGTELVGGPWLCQTLPWGTLSSQCYGPSLQDSLAINLIKDDQTITFNSPPSSAAVGTTYTPTATSTSGLPVTITVAPASNGSCSISGGVVSFLHVGTCILDANQAGNSIYNPAPQVSTSITVTQGTQTVAFTSTPPATPTVGGTYTATASASSGLTVAITNTGACTLSSPSVSNGVTTSVVSFSGPGTCILYANQAGNADYNAATQVQQSLLIKNSQTITWTSTAPTNATVGGTTYTPTATSTSSLVVTITVDSASAAICSISNGIVSFQAVGTCILYANQAGNSTYYPATQVQQTIPVGKGSQTVTFTSTAPTSAVTNTTYTPTASATPSGLTPTITVSSGGSYCSINATTGVVTFTNTGNSVGICVLAANQAGNANYNAAATVYQSISVYLTQTIQFTSTAPTGATVGVGSYTATATATSNLPVTITVDSASANICSISGSTVSFLSQGTCTLNANQSGSSPYGAATQVQQSFTVYSQASTITEVSTSVNPIISAFPIPFITLTANVSSNNNVPPTGTVNFYDSYYGPLATCQNVVVTNGVGSCTTTFTASGLHVITASFYQNGILSSISPVLNQYVVAPPGYVTTPAGPINVTGIPGNGQVTLNWFSPTNTGNQVITGYNVTYNTSTTTTFPYTGCIVNTIPPALVPPTTCNIVNLTNGSPYGFKVTPQYSNPSVSGEISAYSGPITPSTPLTASTPTLAVSGLGGGQKRTVVITNNSVSPITITAVSAPNPVLPVAATVVNFPNSCRASQTLNSGASCTLTIDPGNSPTSSSCTAVPGSAPIPSTITLTYTTNGMTGTLPINVAVLGYGCIYQGGYLFSIDDTTPINGSIGGKVVLANNNYIYAWSSNSLLVEYGISNTSTIAVPDPSTALPGLFLLNCNGINDGACDSYNILLYGDNSPPGSSAAYQCSSTIMGYTGYTDWYLPSLCEWAPNASCVSATNLNGVQNIQTNLSSANRGSFAGSKYWSSTESSADPSKAWEVILSPQASQATSPKGTNNSVACARALTLR